MKKIFVHNIEIFKTDVLICVGVKIEEIKKWADKYSKPMKFILNDKTEYKAIEELMSGSIGMACELKKDNTPYYFMWLKEFGNNWDDINTLNHEIVHLKQFLFKNKGINDEIECEAYFQETTFDVLRRKLTKFIKK